MKFDVVIRNGMIVDGSGAAPHIGDVAIKDGIIQACGKVSETGLQEIDATGLTITPGFIDIHTHLDAQIGWDPDLTPLSWHGVTTVLIGNCGVTFAPCRPEDRELLAAMMETVEDIPKQAILSGLAWDWEQYGEYLDSIARLGTTVNIAGLIGHSAVRYYVMGERAVDDQATEAERREMAHIVSTAIEQGAFGFSTNRFAAHVGPDGRPIPGTYAEVGELTTIAREVAHRNGLMQAVGADFDVLQAIADEAGGRVLFSYGTGPGAGSGQRAAENLDALCKNRNITAVSHVRGSGYLFGLQAGLPFRGPAWRELYEMNFTDRVTAIFNDEFAAQLVAEARLPGATKVPLDQTYFLGADDSPDYTTTTSVAALAKAAGEHWAETLIRLTRQTRGKGLFTYRMFATDMKEQSELFKSANIYPGLGDAGAHVAQIMDAGWATFILSHWTRSQGEFSMADAVHKMTAGPAKVMGLTDRGLIKVGLRADINVFDANEVAELQPELIHDFPHGAPRYTQRAKGFKATIVNGQVSLLNGELTGVRAGSVLRHQA